MSLDREKFINGFKKFLFLSLYWLILFILPSIILPNLVNDGGWIVIYYIIAPFSFLGLYKILEVKNKIEKQYVILLGFIAPLVIVYYYLFAKGFESFNPSF